MWLIGSIDSEWKQWGIKERIFAGKYEIQSDIGSCESQIILKKIVEIFGMKTGDINLKKNQFMETVYEIV